MPGEPGVWYITTCMGRLSALRRSLPTFVQQPHSHVIVVDYSCPDQSGAWAETHFPQCRVVRVPGETFFHLSRARNEGFRVLPPEAEWVCFVDADVCLSPFFYERVRPRLEAGQFMVIPMGPRSRGLIGLILASRADIARCEGFDEGYRSYGRQASAMRIALFGQGLRPVYLDAEVVHHMEHGDEDRARHYRDNDLVRSSIENTRRLRALVQRVEMETGKRIPSELCYKDWEPGLRSLLRKAARRITRLLAHAPGH